MPILDNCITGVYTPGNIPASPGEPPTQVTLGSLYTPGVGGQLDQLVTFSHDYSKWYNAFFNSMLF